MILDPQICGMEELKKYEQDWGKFFKAFSDYTNYSDAPCTTESKKSPCCNFLARMAKNNFNLTLLSLRYSFTNYISSHKPVADYLGLTYFKEFEDRIYPYNSVAFCQLPGDYCLFTFLFVYNAVSLNFYPFFC